MLLFIAVIF